MRGHIYISFHSPSFIDTPNVQGYTGSSLVEQEYKHLIFHFKKYIYNPASLAGTSILQHVNNAHR